MTGTLRMQAATLAAEREQEAARTTRIDLERQREDFVATTSHELRTPITSIVGFCELLAGSDALGDQEKAWVDVIDRNAVRLASSSRTS
ncbi:histidine kinase dimerization/phospho-acceptor domain-containing protein [Leifsonia sp. L25]|uniref:histidine kinase dimerization/phospho-acceptor domain-containing protein n=1 Tax=Leifsonia sp. L25 TaxID=3423957 RepID=UPI003D69161F